MYFQNFFMKYWYRVLIYISSIFFGLLALLLSLNFWFWLKSGDYIYQEQVDIPEKYDIALVLGAQVIWTRLSPILQDRIDTAISLYNSWKVKKILVSWDNWKKYYDEVSAMKLYLIKNWIPTKDIYLDYAGFDTRDSIYRARDIFETDNIIIITQNFHLPRSIVIARFLWIDAVWLSADKHQYKDENKNYFREMFARLKAAYEMLVNKKPTFLGEKIPISWESNASWEN